MVQSRSGYIRFDPRKINRYLAEHLDIKRRIIAGECPVSKAALDNILHGRDVQWFTAQKFVAFLDGPTLLSLMADDKLPEFGEVPQPIVEKTIVSEWMVEGQVTGTNTTSNGLTYAVWKLKHVNEANRFARAKHYQLASVPTDGQNRMNHYLHRHADICNKLARQAPSNAHFPRHITSNGDPKGTAWWVIDEWIDGMTLGESLKCKPLPRDVLPRVMRGIAEGLKALHEQCIICRELSPDSVLCNDDRVVLTDFELGKLLGGEPTVGKDLSFSFYRAPEVGKKPLGKGDEHIDLFSWGRILEYAATGGVLATLSNAIASFDDAPLPPRVREIGKRCLMPADAGRPRTVDEVLKALRGWK
jgi:serine/threonine protein kinase